jgi:hypothetical protein
VRAGALPPRAVRVRPGLPLCAPGRRAAAPGRGHPVLDAQVYAWRALDELAVSAFYTPLRDLGRAALQQLLAERRYPASEQARIEANRPFYGL